MALTPRQHNVLSYLVALGVMPLVAWLTGHAEGRGLWLGFWVLHFARRSAEALWVHRYSKAQFPWGDALVEYVYYWGFAGWIGATLHPFQLTATVCLGGVLFVLGELGNARSHWLLRQLRADSKGKSIPRGFLFEWVSCPHYLCEITTWFGFCLMLQTVAAAAFAGVGSLILAFWARTRHLAYRAEFDGQASRDLYPAARKALLPGIF